MPLSKEEHERLVRIETKIDKLIDHETRIRSLEKKWWTTLGASGLALLAFFKSMFTS